MKQVIIKMLILALVCSLFASFIFTDIFPSARISERNISTKLSEKNVPK
jgi:hypothetical protein